jgi:hypothetical protein
MSGQEGRCVSCGFLGKQDDALVLSHRYPGTFEVEFHERVTPAQLFIGIHPFANVQMGRMRPVCFRRRIAMSDEINDIQAQTGVTRDDASSAVLNKDRRCSEWCEYAPGFDPKEHLMELRQRWLEEDRKRFQLELHAMEQRRQQSEQRLERWLTAAFIFLALAEISATLLGLPPVINYLWPPRPPISITD